METSAAVAEPLAHLEEEGQVLFLFVWFFLLRAFLK